MSELSKHRVDELEGKIATSEDVFRQGYDRFAVEEMRVIWSGGKDSTLTLWICRQFAEKSGLPVPACFTIDEGDAFDQIDEILKTYQ